MKKIDYYILSKFFITCFFTLLSFCLIYIAIDLFDNLNRFLDAKSPFIGYVITYTFKTPLIIGQIFPATCFMAILFTMGNLSKYQEITALQAMGVSVKRISFPLIIVAVFLAGFHFYFNEVIVPNTAMKYYDAKEKYMNKKRGFKRKKTDIVHQDNNDILYIKSFNDKLNIASDVSLQHVVEGEIKYRIDAKILVYEDSIWVFKDLIRRDFFPDTLKYLKLGVLTTALSFKPGDLSEIALKPEELSFFELGKYIKRKKKLGVDVLKWEVEYHSKPAYCMITLLMILFGIKFSTGRIRSASSVNVGMAVGFAFVYYLIIILFKNWGSAGTFSPILASWMPNIFFLIVIVFLMLRSDR